MSSENNREAVQGDPAAEEKRVAARRRFLRIGAGGSAALVMTVTHKRAFAGGIKKGVMASICTSLRGVADLTGVKHKNALETSAMGTPKNMICRPRTNDTNPVGSCTLTHESRYVDANGKVYLVADPGELNKGCGTLELTAQRSETSRLYGAAKRGNTPAGYGEGSGGGYCPIAIDNNGNLNYVLKDYFKLVKAKNGIVSTVKVGTCSPGPL